MKTLILLLCFCSLQGFSQNDCGTKPPPEAEYDLSLAKMKLGNKARGAQPTKYIKVIIIDFLNNAGTDSSWGKEEIRRNFQEAKDLLKPYNICLVLTGIEYIKNTALQDANTDNDVAAIMAAAYHSDFLNIYLHKTLVYSGGWLNGNAYAINSHKLSLSRGAIGQRSMAHEIGHCFGLLHTFETGYGIECPDGSNATTAGDKIADTRATPNADGYLGGTQTALVFTPAMQP